MQSRPTWSQPKRFWSKSDKPDQPTPKVKREISIEKLKEKFEKLRLYVDSRGGWLVSVPGARDVAVEVLPDSLLPADLEDAGYRLTPVEGTFKRMIPNAIEEVIMVRGQPVRRTVHAGLVSTRRFSF